jgi:L-lactate dehydrogenase complex protein LldG
MGASATREADMTGTRDRILARIRASNGRTGPVSADVAASNAARLAAHRANLVPARARGDAAALAERFVAFATEVAATVDRVAGPDAVPPAVAAYLARHNLKAELAAAPDPALDAFPWDRQKTLAIRRGKALPDDAVALTASFAGIAETGSLMVHSGATTPNTLHFMAPTHIAVLRTKDIVGSYEEAWAALRRRLGDEFPPRTVTLITGPSRTSDIEKTSYVGMHGPHRLHIILVDDQTA